jgi:acyl dehydratase
MKAGDVARRTRRVSRRDIELFTEMTGDRNPLHYDEGLAAASRFGGLIVQGGVTTGLLNAVVAEPISRIRTTITNGAGTVVLDGNALVYREPLPAGGRLSS